MNELEDHVARSHRASIYHRLLADFGVDPGRLRDLNQGPRLIYAEQPGSWFTPHDRVRGLLLERLLETCDAFDRLSSGYHYLENDGFTATGDKQMILWFDLHPELGPVRFLGSRTIRRHRRRTYASLSITGAAFERCQAIFDLSEALLEAARHSPWAFTDRVKELLENGLLPGLRPLLPETGERRHLLALGQRLNALYDLPAALGQLRRAGRRLVPGISWSAFWTEVNRHYHETTVRALDPLLNRFLLAIDDPLRMARNLSRCCGLEPHRPVPIVGLVTARETYRMVHFDPVSRDFFYEVGNERRYSVSWDQIRQQAKEGRTGGPSGTLEYLLFAASGIYLIIDSADSFQPFHRHACRIHQHYTDLKFPWLTFESLWPDLPGGGRRGGTLLDVYHRDFEVESQLVIDRFLDG